MKSPNQQALCGKVFPAKNLGGIAWCLGSKAQGSTAPNPGPLPLSFASRGDVVVFDHTAAFVCVTFITWFSFISFIALRGSSSELRHSGHSEMPDALSWVLLAYRWHLHHHLYVCVFTNLSWIFPCRDVCCMTGAIQQQVGQVTRCWWRWVQLVALGAASNSPELPKLSRPCRPAPCPITAAVRAAPNRLQKKNGWGHSCLALLFPKAPCYGITGPAFISLMCVLPERYKPQAR